MLLSGEVLQVFLVFCRIGACLILVPGLSSARVPVRIRLLLALALAFVAAPLVQGGQVQAATPGTLGRAIVVESVLGALIGLAVRFVMEAVEFAAVAMASLAGLSSPSGSIDDGEPLPAMAMLVTLLATTLLVLMDFPQQLVVALIQSYSVLPLATLLDTGVMLGYAAGVLSAAFPAAIRIAAPFLVYGVVVNMMFGILGRLVPQVPTFLVAAPFLALGGLIALHIALPETARQLSHVLEAALPRF